MTNLKRSPVSLKAQVSADEWQARLDLAALYRLVAVHGWDDLIFTHISARIPGPEHHFLINPYGLLFDEVTASSLVKIDLDGKVLQETEYSTNPAGFTIHSAIHAARDDGRFVMHLHAEESMAVAAQSEGLMPLTQHAMLLIPRLAYHDYEGVALNLDERERLVADLGDKDLMLLRNHGALTVGRTAADCWINMHFLLRACRAQIMALAGGRAGALLAPETAQAEVRMQATRGLGGAVAWEASLRKLERASPGYWD
jgi:ribulose-5-phosphate 4-epimerase/fuculose-1-phosphate aldolase